MKQFIVGLAISVVALWLAFKDMDWGAFKEALSQGNIVWIVVASVVLLSAVPLRGIRWQIFLNPIKSVPVRLTTEATIVGYFGNNALPFRLGEILRSYFVAREARAPLTQVFGTVLVERVVDMITVLVLLVLLPFVGAVPDALRLPILWVVIICIVLAIVTVWLARRTDGIPFIKGRLKPVLDNLQLGFTSLRQGRHYVVLLLTTVGVWVVYLMNIYIAQYAMGLELSIAESYLVLVTTTLVLLVPAAPGFVGTFHAAVILAFVNVLSADLARAQAIAVVLHAIGFIPYTIIGAIIYFRSHLRLREVRAQKWEPGTEADQ
ncbi:MAG: flippase-like domain-containing protein [Fidelibacterota bacterium]|nr:MAG: flippase-like domain-containing protein [Candidatus Neomarinimicrobiota bacterium]